MNLFDTVLILFYFLDGHYIHSLPYNIKYFFIAEVLSVLLTGIYELFMDGVSSDYK